MLDTARRRDLAQLVAGAFIISFTGVLVKLAHLGPTNIAFYRMLSGGLILLVVALAGRLRLWHSWRAFLPAAGAGLAFSLDLTFWHRSILDVGLGLATILANFQVFFLALFGVLFLHERFSPRLILAVLLAMSGLFMIVRFDPGRTSAPYSLGVLFGLITAFCYAAYILFLRRTETLTRSGATVPNLALTSLIGALILGLEGLTLRESFRIPDTQTVAAVVGLGVVGQVLGWVVISRVLPRVRASLVGLILLLQPTLSFLWDVLFFGRRLGPIAGLGVILTLGGIYLGAVSRGKEPPLTTGVPPECQY
jgi:drug/metabolite transporter (DMT)-like permease